MRYLNLFVTFLLIIVFNIGCEDKSTPPEIEENDPRYFSGGDLTVFNTTSLAFKDPAPNITDLDLHLEGDLIYETPRVSKGPKFSGLGPVYNNYSCNSCHNSNGRTRPTLWTEGGSGSGYSVFLAFVNSSNGGVIPGVGYVIHDQAIFGAKPEARVHVDYTFETHKYPDGETYELAVPHYSFSDWITGSVPEDILTSVRIPLRHIGLGLILAIPDETILDIAAKQPEESNNIISGRPNYTTDKNGNKRVGHIDHKAENIDLTVEISFTSDIGATNNRFPHESYSDQNPDVPDSVLHHAPDISDADMNAVDYYLHTLGVPARRNINDPLVLRGEKLFREATCINCHRTNIRTTKKMIKTIGGTNVPEVVDQLINPYTDLLLHDMGPELADGRPSGEASGSEWRTTPLWGIGLQYMSNGHTYFLHDGRARNFEEAIMWHGGEANFSREYFKNLPKEDRNAMIKFLESL